MQLADNKLIKAVERANSKLDILTIEIKENRLRIRVRRKDISFAKNTYAATLAGLDATVAICKDIESDYYRGNFDSTLVKYGLSKQDTPKLTEVITLHAEPNLKEIWESYKALKPNPPQSTYKNRWIPVAAILILK